MVLFVLDIIFKLLNGWQNLLSSFWRLWSSSCQYKPKCPSCQAILGPPRLLFWVLPILSFCFSKYNLFTVAVSILYSCKGLCLILKLSISLSWFVKFCFYYSNEDFLFNWCLNISWVHVGSVFALKSSCCVSMILAHFLQIFRNQGTQHF